MYDQRMVLFSGKGGVGKTTLASAFALRCAARGERTLLIELNVKDRLGAIFGSVEVGDEITEIESNLWAVNVTPRAAIREYGMMKLKMRVVYRAVFENRIVAAFLRVIPGLNDLVMLGKSHHHATERDERGAYVWDKVVIDAPATGHGLFFLQIPRVITSIISSGPMFTEAKMIDDFLRDPAQCALHLVTLPEELPVNETLEMKDAIERDHGITIGSVIANAVYEPIFDETERAWIEDHVAASDGSAPEDGLIDAARFRAQRVALQRAQIGRLEARLGRRAVQIPYHFAERFDFQTLRKIANALDAQLAEPT